MLEADIVRASIFPVMLIGAIVIWKIGRNVPGRLLVLIGILHLAGLWVGREPIGRMAAGGFFNQADSAVGNLLPIADQELVFWFALWGVWTMFLGWVVTAVEQQHASLPRSFGWALIVANLACAALMPKGGFWWVLLPGWLLTRERARES